MELTPIGPERTLSQMLVDGELDALFVPQEPPILHERDDIRRLFPDYKAVEKDYFARTGIFPIMHVVVIRREVYERNRWIAGSLYKAFCEAKTLAYEGFTDSSALRYMSPWLIQHAEQARELLGDDFWSYGLDVNREVLGKFLEYHHAQGLSPRLLDVDELFAPETLESFVI